MGLFDLDNIFDFDGDGKTGLFDAFVAAEWFDMYNEYCDLKDKLRKQQSGEAQDDDYDDDISFRIL